MGQSKAVYYIYRLAGFLVPHIPPRVGYWLFARLGDLCYYFSRNARANVVDNLHHVLGPEASRQHIQQVAREIFRNQGRNYYDLFRLPTLSLSKIQSLVAVHGIEHVTKALDAKQGVILVTLHFGNLDVVGQILGIYGIKVTAPAEHLYPPELFRYVCELRSFFGLKLVPADSYMRPLLRALRNSEVVGIAADRNLNQRGTWVEFFGEPALLPDGHVRLAMRTGAKIVVALSRRKSDNTFDATIEPLTDWVQTGNLEEDIQANIKGMVTILERYLRRDPDQWVMFQPVWKVGKNPTKEPNNGG
ncbi:MAG: lysophospholipid acyltransferase family protein [Chloroflexi bacterium]|nr:lysophospholipid acyltransferase family protein [Chloroflexota bacterium]